MVVCNPRAHSGVLFIYGSGARVQLEGVVPVAMLSRVMQCLLWVDWCLAPHAGWTCSHFDIGTEGLGVRLCHCECLA